MQIKVAISFHCIHNRLANNKATNQLYCWEGTGKLTTYPIADGNVMST